MLFKKSKNIYFSDIGYVLFEKSNRAKSVRISIQSKSDIRVAIPYGCSINEAEIIVESKKKWIQKQLKKISDQIDLNKIKNSTDINLIKKYLINRLNELSSRYNFMYNKVFIKNQKTLWGSCSIKNNINLNQKLYYLPKRLIDYVILHELVHTRIKNHSRKFWSMLDSFIKNSKLVDKELKKYRI